jgi:PAS domain S-box-containing protein
MSTDQSQASLRLLINISRQLAKTLDLRTMLTEVLFLSVSNVAAERASLVVLDEGQNAIDAAVIFNDWKEPGAMPNAEKMLEQGLAGWVMRNRQAALLTDTSKDERWVRRPGEDEVEAGPKSAICVPLLVRDELVGILTIVHSIPNTFNEEHLVLLQSISDQSAMALYNARLYSSLQTATRHYHELFDDSIDPIIITDVEGSIIEVNRQAVQMTRFEPGELETRSMLEMHEPDWERLGVQMVNLDDGGMVSYESLLTLKDDRKIPVETYVRRVKTAGEGYLKWVFRDITARKELDILREDLAAMIFHDLRSPLSNIISSLDMLGTLLPEDSPPMLHTVYSIATRSADRMQRLISTLLDVNRLQTTRPVIDHQPVKVVDLFHEALDTVQNLIESKQQKVTLKVPREIPLLYVDEDMIRRVIINLLENAVKYTPAKSEITLGIKQEGEWGTIWIDDDGPGIPEEKRQYIFEKFSRLATDKKVRGFGLGLAFCRLAVEAHKGRIWVENRKKSGSRFAFTVPLARAG